MQYITPKDIYRPKCRELIIEKIIDARENISDRIVDIYISREDILTYFLSEDNWVGILNAVEEELLYRSEENFLTHGEYFDDEFIAHALDLQRDDIIISAEYICYDENHRLRKEDKKYFKSELLPVNDGTDNPEGMITLLSAPNETLVFYATSEHLKFQVGWWRFHIATDFDLKICKTKLKASKELYQRSENCFVDIDNGLIIGALGVEKISSTYGGKENVYYSYPYNLILFSVNPEGSLQREESKKIIDKCTAEQCKELSSKFHKVSDQQVVTFRSGKLRFLKKEIALYKGKP